MDVSVSVEVVEGVALVGWVETWVASWVGPSLAVGLVGWVFGSWRWDVVALREDAVYKVRQGKFFYTANAIRIMIYM